MARHPHRHGIEPGSGQITHLVWRTDGGDKGQGSWPKGAGQLLRARIQNGQGLCGRKACDMRNQGVKAWPSLGLIDGRNRDGIAGIGRQSINRFGRQ
jgi:hypothetical protein